MLKTDKDNTLKIASSAEKISRKIYGEAFLINQSIKPEEAEKINKALNEVLVLLNKISVRIIR